MKLLRFTYALAILSLVPGAVAETHSRARLQQFTNPTPASTVLELNRQQKHYEAVLAYTERDAKTLSLTEKLAAARSAWALGLVDTSRNIWQEASSRRGFTGSERSRALLAYSIMEFQEGNYEKSRSLAEQEAQNLPASDLRSQFWLVIAEALKAQGAWSLAEGYYNKALEEAEQAHSSEATYLLGSCQLRLGKVNDARYTFASLDTSSKNTADALRRLAEIDLGQGNYEGVLTWLEEGRESYPSLFNDSWTSYAEVTSLSRLSRAQDARKALTRAQKNHSDNDPWILFARSALESHLAKQLLENENADGEE